jgi:hypothetical protein
MSVRRKTTTSPQFEQHATYVDGGGLITDTGFGICEDGSIGFAGCVLKSSSQSAGLATMMTMAAPDGPSAAASPTIITEASKTTTTSAIMSNRDAQKYMASGFGKPAPTRMMCSCPDDSDETPGRMMCTCPDGGIPADKAFMNGYSKCGRNDMGHDSDDSDEEYMGGGLIGSVSKLGKSGMKHAGAMFKKLVDGKPKHTKVEKKTLREKAMDSMKKAGADVKKGAKKILGMKERANAMNAMVFEAVANKPYSKLAAQVCHFFCICLFFVLQKIDTKLTQMTGS